ncbi:TIGR02301 family protein [bacterium]|nr:TIGR02301 family protein [bacterium]
MRFAGPLFRVNALGAALAAMLAAAVVSPPRAAAQEPEVQRMAQLVELASTLGEAHAIRVLCNGDDDQYWRRFMMDMLDIEATDSGLRGTFVSAFNRGYRSQASRDRCTPALVGVEAEIATRGKALADAIARSYME